MNKMEVVESNKSKGLSRPSFVGSQVFRWSSYVFYVALLVTMVLLQLELACLLPPFYRCKLTIRIQSIDLIMSAGPFRSHLLQQWARSNQSRPPVAVVPWLQKHQQTSSNSENDSASRRRFSSPSRSSQSYVIPTISSIDTTPSSPSGNQSSQRLYHQASLARKPTISGDDSMQEDEFPVGGLLSLPYLMRRRRAQFLSLLQNVAQQATQTETSSLLYRISHEQIPFQLKSFVAPSPKIDEMLDILRLTHLNNDDNASRTSEALEELLEEWRKIPAFLVAIIPYGDDDKSNNNDQDANMQKKTRVDIEDALNLEKHEHTPLKYCPPQTQEDLERYAATIAAMQNIMTQLRTDHDISSKWSTDPMIHTPAFRKLLGLDDGGGRIVGILCVG